MALSDLVSRTKKKFDDFFAPAPQMRVRDVVREAPQAIKTTVQAVRTGGLAGLGKKISDSLATGTDYFAPTPKVRVRDFVRELPTGIGETANKVMQDATRFGISVKELPETFRSGKATGKFYDTPVGRLNSYQSEAQNRVERGDPLWKAIGNPAAETVLFAAPDATALGKSVVKSPLVKAVGKRVLGKTFQNEAKDIVADGGLKVAQLARPYVFGKYGTPYRSKTFRSLSRPGGTIIAVDPKSGFYPEGSYSSLFDKRAKLEIDDSKSTIREFLPEKEAEKAKLIAKERLDAHLEKLKSRGLSTKEINDDPTFAKLLDEFHNPQGGAYDGSLEGVLKHDELYEKYPWLRRTNVFASVRGEGKSGYYNPEMNHIQIEAGSPDELHQGLLHEAQHAIQEYEGFARGGSPESMSREFVKLRKEISGHNVEMSRIANAMDIPKNRLNKEKMKSLKSEYDDVMALRDEAARKLQRIDNHEITSEYDAYKRLGGELESRSVERRFKMRSEDRKHSDPYAEEAKATPGIKSSDDIITRFESGVMMDESFTPKMWSELNKLAGKSVRTAAEDARYFDLENRLYQLPMEDQMKLLGADDIADELIDTTGELQHQFDTFVGLFKNPKLRNPKVKDAIMDGDLGTLKRELSARGVMSPDQVDNMLYDQEKSGDELLDMFKDRLKRENPELMMGKKFARNLGAVDEGESVVDRRFTNEAEKFMEEARASSPFGGFLPSGQKETPLMLPMGRDFTSKEAKRIMQKTGMAVPFKDTLKPGAKPLVFGETGADFRRLGVDAKVQTEKVPVKYEYTDPEAPENLSTVRKWITSGETILNKMGTAGREQARRMSSQRKAEDMLRGSYHLDVEDALKKLPENERFMVADVLDGKAVENAPERVTTAAAKMRALLDEVADEASVGGFTIRTPDGEVPFKRMENYYPRQYDFDELKKGAMHEKALEHMVATGQARNKAEAEKMLNDFIMANTERRSGNLENARMFDVPGYERDPLIALKRYTAGVAKRFTEAKYFGKKDEMIASLINKIAQNNGDYNEAQRIFDLQVEGMPKNAAVSAVTKFNVATKLDLAFITNATQSLNTITKAGLMNTIFGAARGFTKEGRRLAKKIGAVQDSHIYEQESGTFDSIAKAIMIPFRIVENFNRRTAANTGVIRAKELVERAQKGSRYAIREMKKLGLDPTKKDLSEQDLLTAAYEMARQTQFKVEGLDIPPAWKTPLGRLITQFKSFSFVQTKFIRDEVAKELAHGNVMPLIRFVPLAIGASMGAQYVRNILTGRDPKDDTKNVDIRQWDKWLKGFGTIPTDLIIQGKFLKDTYDSEYLTAMKKLSRVLGSTLGVTAGTIGSYLAAIESISSTEEKNKQLGVEKEKQDPYLDLKRQAMGDVPVVGEYLKNTLYPYKKSDKTDEEKAQTKAYFDTKERVTAGMTTKERAALDALPATNPLNPWSKIQKYTTYRTSPAVFEAKRQLALTEAGGDKEKMDPLFRYKYEAVMPYLAYQSLLPNARERKALREKNPIIMQLGKERSEFFDANPIDPEFAQPNIPGLLPYPAPDEETSKLMDAKQWKHPKVQAYFDARDAWESQVYALAGVPLTQDGFGFGGGGKKPKKPDYADLPFQDLDDFLTKRGMEVSPKAQFGTGVPIAKPTFSMPTRSQVSKAKTTERKQNKIGVSFRGRQLV